MNPSTKVTKLETPKHLLEWPKHLRTPAELLQSLRHKTRLKIIRSPQCSKIVLQIVGSWAYLIARIVNRTQVVNFDTFNIELKRIESQNRAAQKRIAASGSELESSAILKHRHHQQDEGPLLTYSNHISCIDDPVLWGALLPLSYYSRQTDSVRWAPAAIDICFSKPWHSAFFALGKTFPIVRGVGLNQPAMDFASALLNYSQWLHLFPEGRVMRDKDQQIISNLDRGYIFKWGISKLILDHFKLSNGVDPPDQRTLRILPFYHLGMDEVLPIGWPYVPRVNKTITILLRESVIEMNSTLLNQILQSKTSGQMKSRTADEIKLIKVTNFLERELEKLIEPATRLHAGRGG